MATLFSQIIAGDIPAFTLYEDDLVYAFLDIFPQQSGHTLLVPKREVDHFSDLTLEECNAMFSAAQKLSKAIKKATNCNRVCASFVGYEIPHCHWHLVPTNTIADANFAEANRADDADLKAIQDKILENL